jgi:hypothetical protein
MKMKFGAIVVAGSGKIGGHVASHNRHGAYLRTKVTPVNPQTSFQNTVRSRLSSLSQAWRALTAAQIASWNSAVLDFQKTNVFGDLKSPSGFNLYQRLNNNLVAIGQSQITSPPSPAAVLTVAIGALVANVTGAVLTIALGGAVPTATSMKVFITPPVSPGKSFVKSEYRLLQVFAAATASPANLAAAYAARFGLLVEGQKMFCKIVFVDDATGLESLPQSTSIITINV